MPKKLSKAVHHEYWAYPNMNKALEIALYYGFTPADAEPIEKADKDSVKGFSSEETQYFRPEEKAALIRKHFGEGSNQSPIMIATPHDEHRHGRSIEYSLDVIGTNRSIADATLIKTAYEIIRAEGYDDPILELNSIGDRESFARFIRELNNYFKKNMSELHADCRQIMKKSIYQAARCCEHTECKTIKERAPHPMNYLSEPSRAYFMELLELLETTDIPYTLNNELIVNHDCAMHTIFRIYADNGKNNEVLAYGARWGVIAKKMGFKKDVQGMCATVLIKKPERSEKVAKIKKPQVYFVQMGQEAKLKSLRVIEILRRSRIPVYHSLIKDKLTAQLVSAENLKVPYILLMGQKESLENTIVIREMSNRSQETIRVEQIADYLKRIIR